MYIEEEILINNLLVIYGGISSERHISLKSCKSILKILKKNHINYSILDIKYFSLNIINNYLFDKVFIVLHGGFGEGGVVQGFLEFLNIPYTGSGVFTSSLCLNKYRSKIYLSNFNINVGNFCYIDKKNRKKYLLDLDFKNKIINKLIYKINFPMVIKPVDQGSSIDVIYIKNKNNLVKNIDYMFEKYDYFLVEEYINGIECTVGVLFGVVLSTLVIKKNKYIYDYDSKYKKIKDYNDVIINYFDNDIVNIIKKKCIKIWNVLNCKDFVRIDFIIDKYNNFIFLEVNTIPGLYKNSLFSISANEYGIGYEEMIKKIVLHK